MSAEQYDYLQKKNSHKRDELIEFDEPTHVYTVKKDSNYMSVTTFNHSHFEHFDADKIIQNMMNSPKWPQNKYFGKSPREIKLLWDNNRDEAARAGTAMHLDIEKYYNNIPVDNSSIEFSYFKNYHKDFIESNPHIVPWRTEMMVWDEEYKLAGSIDMIFIDLNTNELIIVDWKRSKEIKKINGFGKCGNKMCIEHLPDANFWHYSLQLGTYKHIIEKNYGKKVKEMYLVCLHPNNKNKNYLKINVANLDQEIVELLKLRKENLKINL